MARLQGDYQAKLKENKSLKDQCAIAVAELELRGRQINALRYSLEQRNKMNGSIVQYQTQINTSISSEAFAEPDKIHYELSMAQQETKLLKEAN